MNVRGTWIRMILAPILLAALPTGLARATDLESQFTSFYRLGLAESGVSVADRTLVRGDAQITFTRGVFVPAQPLDNVVTGGVFLGSGELLLRPSRAMDRNVLRLRTAEWLRKPVEEYRGTFTRAVLRFYDSTLQDLSAGGAGDATYDRGQAAEAWKTRNAGLENMDDLGPLSFVNFSLEMDFLAARGAGEAGRRFFVAEFETPEDGWLTFILDDNLIHEMFFGNHLPLGLQEEVHPFLLTSVKEDFDATGRYTVAPEKDDKLALDTDHYRVNVTIPDTARLTMESTIDFTPRVPLRRVRFDLVNNISPGGYAKWSDRGRPVDVTSVTDGAGNKLAFIHKRHQILIEYSEDLPAGASTSLSINADEKTIIQLSPESYWLLNTYPWFPQIGFAGARSTHEWTVRTKGTLSAVVSGKLVREWEEDGFHCTSWTMNEPVQFPSLIFGRFASQTDVYHSELSGRDVTLRVSAIPIGTMGGISYAGVKRSQPVLDEAKAIMKFYESLYGPYPFEYLNIAQMAVGLGFGQAPPGLVQLTGEAFMSSSTLAAMEVRADFFHEFFAHEIGHQWWAHAVWGTSFRDSWLSESFAEYSAGLYIQQLRGQDQFQSKLKDWRQHADQARGTAPLAALSTLGGTRAGADYTNLIYNKGPYVVHMLRMQMGHDKWVAGMKSFFAKHNLVNLKTEDLIAEMEVAAGYKLDFFFDQWWKGTATPSLRFVYDLKATEDGKFLFTGTVSQDGTPFKLMLPVFFHFGGKKVSIQSRPIVEATDIYKVVLPERPQKVTLDDFNTLLADFPQ